MGYHPAYEPEPVPAPPHPFAAGFTTAAVVAAITALLAIAAGVPNVLYGAAGSAGTFAALAVFYRWLGQRRSRSVDVRSEGCQGIHAGADRP